MDFQNSWVMPLGMTAILKILAGRDGLGPFRPAAGGENQSARREEKQDFFFEGPFME